MTLRSAPGAFLLQFLEEYVPYLYLVNTNQLKLKRCNIFQTVSNDYK